MKILTLEEVAALTRVPAATLRFWRHKGIGPQSFRVGRRVVYKEADVVAWLDEQIASDPRPVG
jgi:DNA-binding transcriptional MerR regulator